MNVNLSPEIEKRVKDELPAGQFQDMNHFVETAVQYFLDQHQRSQRRLDALRRIGQASTTPVCTTACWCQVRNEYRSAKALTPASSGSQIYDAFSAPLLKLIGYGVIAP